MILGIIISGIIFIALDKMLEWVTKDDKPLYTAIDKLVEKVSGKNAWLYFLIPFLIGMACFYASTLFPDKSAAAVVFEFAGFILLGYIASDWVRGMV